MKTLIKGALISFTLAFLLIFEIQAQTQSNTLSKDKNFNQPVGVYNASSAGSAANASAGLQEQTPELGEPCSMYMSDEWQTGTIKLKGNTIYENVPLRYNIYNQQIEFVLDNDTAAVGDPATIEYIHIGGHTFVYETFFCENRLKTGYLEVLSEGRMRLLVFRNIKYVSVENDAVTGLESERKYHLDKIFLYAFPGENAKKLPEKRKELLALFTTELPDFEVYLKSYKNKLKSESELIAAFNYFNEHLK